MNNNNQQKRYFSPMRVFLYSIAAFICVLHAQVCYGCADEKAGNGRRLQRAAGTAAEYDRGSIKSDSRKSNDGRTNDDRIIDAVYAGNAAEDGFVDFTGNRDTGIPTKDASVKDHGAGIITGQVDNAVEGYDKPDSFDYGEMFNLTPDQIRGIIKNVSSSVNFPDGFDQGNVGKVTGISSKNDTSKDSGTGVTSGKKTNSDTNRGQGNIWAGFDNGNDFKDPFNNQKGVLDENKKYEIPGLIASATAMTKSNVISYIIIISFLLFVN